MRLTAARSRLAVPAGCPTHEAAYDRWPTSFAWSTTIRSVTTFELRRYSELQAAAPTARPPSGRFWTIESSPETSALQPRGCLQVPLPQPAVSHPATRLICAFAPAGGRKGMLMTAFRALTARFTDPLELELVYTAWLNDLAYALNDLTLASEVMAMAVEKRVPSPHSISFFASTCETIATTLTDNQQLKEALSWLGWMSELFRDDFANLALVKKKSKASHTSKWPCQVPQSSLVFV